MKKLGIAQRGDSRGKKNILRHTILGKVRRVVGTCSRKPHILF